MTATTEQISRLLHEAGETHHRVFRIAGGADDDWASWYSNWLINLSELPSLLGTKPVRSELTYLLVSLDKDYTASQPSEPWERTTPSASSITSVPPNAEPAAGTAGLLPGNARYAAYSALGCRHEVGSCGTSAYERRRPRADWSRRAAPGLVPGLLRPIPSP
jgi:hypothetical protein